MEISRYKFYRIFFIVYLSLLCLFTTLYTVEIESKESQIQLALNAYNKAQFKTFQSVYSAFNVP